MIEAVLNPENIALANAFYERLDDGLKDKVGAKFKKHFLSFKEHLIDTYSKNDSVRLICSKSVETKLSDVYVSTFFYCRDTTEDRVSDDQIIEKVRKNQRLIVRGNGGTGKTFFLKKLWNDIFENPEGKVPVFIELRRFNPVETPDIETLIRYTLSTKKDISSSVFNELSQHGKFIFIFDGFDEVTGEKRDILERQLFHLDEKYKNCGFIISSRSSERFDGWSKFKIYDVCSFDYKQIRTLIEKAPVPEELKKSFLKVLSEDFFAKHIEFLSSPLLALMMLITFRDQADIPDNLNEFYENCFSALYREHDATKQSFRRRHFLSITEFKRLFATFCAMSYQQGKYEFKQAEFTHYLEQSLRWVNINCNEANKIGASVEEIKHEIVESVNLMQLDGPVYSFIHRSFQEYFAAYFAVTLQVDRTAKLLKVFSRRSTDNALGIAYEMNQKAVEKYYILNEYQLLVEAHSIDKKFDKSLFNYSSTNKFEFFLYEIPLLQNEKNIKQARTRIGYEDSLTEYFFSVDRLLNKIPETEQLAKVVDSISKEMPLDVYKQIEKIPKKASVVFLSFTENQPSYFYSTKKRITDIKDIQASRNLKIGEKLASLCDELENTLETVHDVVYDICKEIEESHKSSASTIDEMFFS